MTNAVLEGASGGQNLRGGTGASEDLTLSSTNHATKDRIFFGVNSAFDELNTRLGIGIAVPVAPIHGYQANSTLNDQAPSTSGTTPKQPMARFSNVRGTVLDIGFQHGSPFAIWLQATDAGNLGTEYPLHINPNGGEVIIGPSAFTVGGLATFNGKVSMPGMAAIGEATEIAEANAAVVRVGEVDDEWGDYAKFIGAEGPGRFQWGAWENMGTSGSPKNLVSTASGFKPAKGVTAWGLVHNITAGAMGRFDVGPVLLNTVNTLYDAGGGKTAVLSVGSNGQVSLYKTGSDELDIVYFVMWL